MRDCDHWHEGVGFVTSHMAFTLDYEQCVQSIFPQVCACDQTFAQFIDAGLRQRYRSGTSLSRAHSIHPATSETHRCSRRTGWEMYDPKTLFITYIGQYAHKRCL
jgi:hypothetical protein